MTPQEKQRLSQNEERLRRLPPAQQQMLRERAQVWQRMTPRQRDHVRNEVLPKWREMARTGVKLFSSDCVYCKICRSRRETGD